MFTGIMESGFAEHLSQLLRMQITTCRTKNSHYTFYGSFRYRFITGGCAPMKIEATVREIGKYAYKSPIENYVWIWSNNDTSITSNPSINPPTTT